MSSIRILVVSSQSQQGENEHRAVAVHDGCGDALMDGAPWPPRSGGASACWAPGEVLGLLESPDKLHDGEDFLVAAALLPLFQLQDEEQAEAGLHHHPVHHAGRLMSMDRNTMSSPGWKWRCPVFQDLAKFGETKNITVPDILLETDVGTEAVQFIVQCLYTG